jgi:FkbM family methyltransferase
MRLVTTPGGQQFWCYNSDGMGRELEEKGGWEQHLYKYFRVPRLAAWRYVLEVGANIGIHTRELATRYKRVIAVEPLTGLALRANTAHLPGVEVHEVAGWSTRARMVLAPKEQQQTTAHYLDQQELCPNVGAVALLPWDHPLRRGATVVVAEALPLDLIVGLRGVDFIKIDAQGCDYACLLGLEETIRRCRPFILSEYEPDLAKLHGVTPEVYRKWFADHDYLEGPVDGDRVNSWGVPRERLEEAVRAGCGVNE